MIDSLPLPACALASALAIAAAFAAAPAAFAQPADLVVHNAKIWTADEARPAASAIAVRDGRILALAADDAAIRAHVGPQTRIIDARGRRLVPGLIDAHVHLVGAAISRSRLELRDASSRDDLLERLRRAAEKLPPGAWIVGRGWSAESWPDQRPPTADEIARAAGGRPAVLIRMDGHSMLASRAALLAAGVTQDGPADPPGGHIARDERGIPTGAVFEEAMEIITRLVPTDSPEHVRALVREAVAEANSLGLTQLGTLESQRTVEEILIPLDRAGGLNVRLHVTIQEPFDTADEWAPVFDWIEANRAPSPNIRIVGAKAYMDGSLGSRTAWMTAPYLDNPPGTPADNAGMPLAMAGSGELRTWIHRAAVRGIQPVVHAIGDRANHILLGWFAELPDDRRAAVRPSVEHAQHLLAEDIPRLAALGVAASMQPLHKADDGRYAESRLGLERLRAGAYAYRALLDAGARVAFGSDWPVVSENPFEGVAAAISGRAMDGRSFLPEQSITAEEALRCYTAHAAWRNHAETETGALRPGMAADFAILSEDPLQLDGHAIARVVADLCVVGGRIVHER